MNDENKHTHRLGILTSGGDAPGMNSALRAAVRTALEADIEAAAGGKVEFPMSLASALDPSRYTYEVKVDDGSYITTFAKAIMEIV